MPLDKLAYLAALAGPLSAVSQIIQIIRTRTSAGVSIITWVIFLLMSLVWLRHARMRHDAALALSNVLWILVEALVIAAALIYP